MMTLTPRLLFRLLFGFNPLGYTAALKPVFDKTYPGVAEHLERVRHFTGVMLLEMALVVGFLALVAIGVFPDAMFGGILLGLVIGTWITRGFFLIRAFRAMVAAPQMQQSIADFKAARSNRPTDHLRSKRKSKGARRA